MKNTCVIIDDERLVRLALRKDLEKFPEIVILGEASSIKTAKPLIKQINPDILFLDIQLSDGNGFDLLNQIEYSGKVIFITAYDEYAIRAFEVNALDYLLKPLSIIRLKETIDRLNTNNQNDSNLSAPVLKYNDRIMVIHKKSVNFIMLNIISCITASKEYSYIRTIDGNEYFTSKSIGEWESRLPNENFCRIHRSSIINFDFIKKIEHYSTGNAKVILQGLNEPITISRNYFKRLKGRYCL